MSVDENLDTQITKIYNIWIRYIKSIVIKISQSENQENYLRNKWSSEVNKVVQTLNIWYEYKIYTYVPENLH